MKPEVAVVIPTCRRPALLRRCLEAVLGQTLEPGRYEVIVVDDGHDEACRAAVLRMAARTGAPTLRYLRPLMVGVSSMSVC